MARLKEAYKNNIYGVIGTLIFHILLVSAFLFADVDSKGKIKEESVFIEFPEEIFEDVKEEAVEKHEESIIPSNDLNNPSMRTNRASNQAFENDDFFDEDYQKELDEARKLVSDVSKQLDKKVINIEDIKMPVETTEGMDPDSIKNKLYSGDSNISYFLDDRFHVSLPVPIYLAQGGGEVIVDILVDRKGVVIKATVRKNTSVLDAQIYRFAQLAASNTLFNPDSSAPEQQAGTIQYVFVAQ